MQARTTKDIIKALNQIKEASKVMIPIAVAAYAYSIAIHSNILNPVENSKDLGLLGQMDLMKSPKSETIAVGNEWLTEDLITKSDPERLPQPKRRPSVSEANGFGVDLAKLMGGATSNPTGLEYSASRKRP